MTLTTASDISLVLSGGATNIDPNLSLGGDPSAAPVASGILNNLFADVAADQTADGYEDYRCVYLFNDGPTAVYAVELWVAANDPDGAIIELGIADQNEAQRVTISGAVLTGGSLTLSYQGAEFTTAYDDDLSVWAAALEVAILDLTDGSDPFFTDVTVLAQTAGSGTVIFDITFDGLDAKRNFDKFEVAANDLEPAVSVLVTAPRDGSPVNTVASSVNVETTPPGGVGFFVPTPASPILIPRLAPNDGFPLWVKRTTPAGVEAVEANGFVLGFRADSLAPA
jgi:hypothetical protein